MISSRDFTRSSCSTVTVVVTGHSSRRSPPPRCTPTGNGLQRGQFCWPPPGKTVGRQRAATWPPLGRISWPPTVPSIGSVGDSYDNALAEAVNALYKTELIRGPAQGPWRTIDDVELATLGWVHWS